MNRSSNSETLQRIHAGLEAARKVLSRFTPGAIETEYKIGHDPVTEADRQVDAVLREHLLRDGEGWLSEESRGWRNLQSRNQRDFYWLVRKWGYVQRQSGTAQPEENPRWSPGARQPQRSKARRMAAVH